MRQIFSRYYLSPRFFYRKLVTAPPNIKNNFILPDLIGEKKRKKETLNLIFVSSHRFLFVVLFIKHCIPPGSTINFSSCLQRLRSTRYVDRIKSQSVERARNLFITMMIDGYVAAHQKPKTSSMIQSIASNWYRV